MDEFNKKLKEYEEFFKDGFPTFQFMSQSPEQIIELIDSCLEEGKDVYEMGILKDDPDIMY